MQQAVVSNLHAITTSPAAPRSRFTWTSSPSCVVVPKRGSVKARSMRNGSTDSLDHLQRASKPRQQQQASPPSPRRRLIQTTPFGLWDSFPEARTLDQMVRTMERIMDGEGDDDDGRVLVVPAAVASSAVPRADAGSNGVAVPAAGGASGAAYRRRGGRTPWEVRERAGEYLVRFDMPGMTREDVRVSVRDRTLVVAAEKKDDAAAAEEEEEGEGEPWPAASFGRYRTRFELPENVDVERIAAEVRDGVLYLTIPKLSAWGKVVNIQVQ
ncbi:hypothetical protein GQ55_6G156300 [Panicum hallii var. hallii]|uniref:SHSP domain-containing protein n=1 Tax=Panicum hallii var. hallii TaxID=1504633 RepID=A0A2T7D6G4_9POAL|nr:hypothetical protein GQ55_6G156300 [Panicum hallii var. hallii]